MKNQLLLFTFCILAFATNAQTLPGTYVQTTVVTGLSYPSDFDWLPDGRYIVTQKGGFNATAVNALIRIFKADGTAIGTFYNLNDSVNAEGEQGLHGIAVDPDFNNNHFVYVYYTYRNPAKTVKELRVLRLTEASNVGTSPKLIFRNKYVSPNTNHVGGIIRISPNEPTKLFIQTGDLAINQGTPANNHANKLNNPYGKILRINTDGTIPTDNPFYDDGDPDVGNDDRIWSYGHRNGFGMCFNPVTDSLYISENGWNAWDEFNIIHKGGNYGWATCEGDYINSSTSTPCTDPTFVKPIATWGSPLPAVTGCVYYSGTVMPEFTNHIIVADNDNGILYDLTMGNAPAYDVVSNKKNFADLESPGSGLTTVRQGTDGCIYAMRGGYTNAGRIYKICHKTTAVNSLTSIVNEIGQNYPNPASDKAQIDYSVEQTSRVIISLVDVAGRTVRTLLNTEVQPGKHTLEINDLSSLPNGSYFYKMDVQQNNKISFSQTKRMIVLN